MSSNDAGKYYCEVKIVSASAYSLVGLVADKLTTSATSNLVKTMQVWLFL